MSTDNHFPIDAGLHKDRLHSNGVLRNLKRKQSNEGADDDCDDDDDDVAMTLTEKRAMIGGFNGVGSEATLFGSSARNQLYPLLGDGCQGRLNGFEDAKRPEDEADGRKSKSSLAASAVGAVDDDPHSARRSDQSRDEKLCQSRSAFMADDNDDATDDDNDGYDFVAEKAVDLSSDKVRPIAKDTQVAMETDVIATQERIAERGERLCF